MRKIAILIHQYGGDVVGGAESYAKSLAEQLANSCEVTVLTTASNDYATWEDHYKPGKEIVNDVEVIRFSVEKLRNERFAHLCNELAPRLDGGGETTYLEDDKWIEWEGPYCPAMVEYVKTNYNKYDAFIVITYIYYIAVKCIPEIYNKTIFIPTAHDETWLRLNVMKDIFRMPRYFGFLTEEERDLVHDRFNNDYIPSDILGIGIEINTSVDPIRFRKKFNISDPYLIYVGRIDGSKNCDELINHFIYYKKHHKTAIKLVLVGRGNMHVPKSSDIIVTGFVSEQEKYDGIAGAFAMVTPSKYESLCIALLEALALKVPVIANAQCAVLKGQCIRSNAGLYYDNEQQFSDIVDYLFSHPKHCLQMGENGLGYVEERYRWSLVVKKILDIVENIYDVDQQLKQYIEEVKPEAHKVLVNSPDEQIQPIWKDAVTIVTSADNNYADFAAMTINSIIRNASDNRYYDILVLTNDIVDEKISEIVSLTHNRKNCSVRFVYLSPVIRCLDIKVSTNYNEVTYFRLLIPQMMKQYEKIIYLDSDILITANIEELWDLNLKNNLLAATWDSLATAWQTHDSGPQAYFEALGLDEIGHYIQAGVIVFNISEMNRMFPMNYLIRQSCNQRYILADQDIINVFGKGRIVYIDHSWNVRNFTTDVWDYCRIHLPRYLMRSEMNAVESPKAIHYCESSFPCWKTDRMFNNEYWQYAWNTSFYSKMIRKRIKKIDEIISQQIENIDVNEVSTDNNNVLSVMQYNDRVKEDMDTLIVYSRGEIYGPNISLGKGEHRLIVNCIMKDNNIMPVKVVAGARNIMLGTKMIHSGRNEFLFECTKNQIDVEILLENNTNEKVRITKLIFQ